MVSLEPRTLLRFDSEFESGNLEIALYETTKVPAQKTSVEAEAPLIEKYKLFVQNDYNSKGHQQWFNFTVTNLQPDTCYEL